MALAQQNNRTNMAGQRMLDYMDSLSPYFLILPIALLLAVLAVLIGNNALNYEGCIALQKPIFYFINQQLLTSPMLEYNLTQLGDTLVFLSFLTVLIVYRPRVWQALIPALIISAIITPLLKSFFAMPRPAAIFDHDTFTIMGRTLMGHNSLPSGHSVTIFTILTILIVGFMPKPKALRWLWVLGMIVLGVFVALSRVAVGAHHPLDVYVGSCLGVICGMLGIFFLQRFPALVQWVGQRRWHPFFMLVIIVCVVVLVLKIIQTPLVICFLSILSLLISLYVIVKDFAQK